jgi:alkylation response protein AidB-like acyl-CoA dehydrogenase
MAFTEPAAGSDLAGIQSTVRPTADGLVLRGAKTFISNAPTADVYLVAAVRADHAAKSREERVRGMGLWVVSRGAPGLVVGPPLAKLGMRSSETGELTFDDVPVLPPPGGPGGGRGDGSFRAMMALLDVNRLYIAGLSLGLAQAAFEASVSYVQTRHAFGRPIAEYQATGFKVARMAMKLDAARGLLQQACEAFDTGERATRLVSEAKLFATEAAVEITGDAVQIHGGSGYMEGFPVERYFRDAKVGTIWEGTSEIQQHVICRELGLYR